MIKSKSLMIKAKVNCRMCGEKEKKGPHPLCRIFSERIVNLETQNSVLLNQIEIRGVRIAELEAEIAEQRKWAKWNRDEWKQRAEDLRHSYNAILEEKGKKNVG